NRTRYIEDAGTARITWTYDATNQLLSESRTGGTSFKNTYVYDSRGNRTLKRTSSARTTTTYDAANQIVSSKTGTSRTTYTFDSNGNQQRVLDASGNRTTTTWDYENQPTLYK